MAKFMIEHWDESEVQNAYLCSRDQVNQNYFYYVEAPSKQAAVDAYWKYVMISTQKDRVDDALLLGFIENFVAQKKELYHFQNPEKVTVILNDLLEIYGHVVKQFERDKALQKLSEHQSNFEQITDCSNPLVYATATHFDIDEFCDAFSESDRELMWCSFFDPSPRSVLKLTDIEEETKRLHSK